MLRGIHQATSTFIGKTLMTIVMGALVVAFAIWGIGDIFRGYGRNDVAKVGSAEISIEQFREYYNDRIRRISRQIGKPVTPEQARALGLDRQILGQMIAETTLNQQASNMRLGLNDATIAKNIEQRPHLQRARRQVQPPAFRGNHPQRRLHRGALRGRAAQRHAAPADRRERQRRHVGAEDRDQGDQSVPHRKARHRLPRARAGPGRHHRDAVGRRTEEILRRPQGHVPRAGIPPGHARVAVAGGARRPRQRHRRAGQGLLRPAQGEFRQAGKARSAPDPVQERSRRQGRAREDRKRVDLRRHRQGARA